MIHVCFGLYDKTGRYSKFTGTTLLSIFANTKSEVTAHILHDNTLTQDNIDKFSAVAEQFNQRVKFYNVETLCADGLATIKNALSENFIVKYSVGAIYRFLVPEILSSDIEKIIYLDSDIVVNLDIAELWRIDLGDKMLAAAPEAVINHLDHPFYAKTKFLLVKELTAYDDYFNSGVLLFNLNAFRHEEENLLRGIKFASSHSEIDCFDQDILNYLYSKNYVKLPEKFDVFVGIERRMGKNYLRDAIYHYAGRTCGLDMNDAFNRLWMKYFIQTPWFDEESIGRLYIGSQKIQDSLRGTMIKLTALVSGKTRGFIVLKNDVDAIKKLFVVRNDEELITVERDTPRQEIFERMNASRGKKIFFVFVQNFPFVNFEKLGFVYGRDFLNGLELLSDAQTLAVNSHLLLNAM